MALYKKIFFSEDESDKDDVYTLSINNDSNYQGEYKICNLSIWYALTIFCDINEGKLEILNVYIQNAEDDEYKMRLIDKSKISELAEDLDEFLECIKKDLSTMN